MNAERIKTSKPPKATNRKLIRGVPVAHYHRLRRLVLRGDLTWAEAVRAGVCLVDTRTAAGGKTKTGKALRGGVASARPARRKAKRGAK